MSTFRSAIAAKLKELKVGTSHTSAYVKQMRTFYDELFALSNGTEAAGGVLLVLTLILPENRLSFFYKSLYPFFCICGAKAFSKGL